MMPLTNRLYAEFIGTAWLVLGGCGSAVLAAAFPGLGIGFAGVALFAGDWAMRQLWLFWLAPIAGGGVGGIVYRALVEPRAGRRTQAAGA